MNLKFTNDIFKTFSDMKSHFYTLGLLVGVQTITFTCYLLYKYYTKENTKNVKDVTEENEIQLNEINELEVNEINELEVNEINNLDAKVELYNTLMINHNELEQLILHLGDLQTNINIIRDKLEELNNKKNI
jgi:hypothetical protein